MARLEPAQLERLVAYLKATDRDAPGLRDVITLAELTAESLKTFYARLDTEVYGELVSIARFIGSMHQEIAALGVNDLKDARLPGAGHELDEIVRATENATNSIMGCAEELLAADASDPAFADNVQDVATRIFEACAFQDLTGQRIAKVVETLRVIEGRVARFANAVKLPDEAGVNAEEAARAARKRDLILNGPQAKGVAIEQDAIDALLGSEADQSAVDALFN